jgi:hypothetical protein
VSVVGRVKSWRLMEGSVEERIKGRCQRDEVATWGVEGVLPVEIVC